MKVVDVDEVEMRVLERRIVEAEMASTTLTQIALMLTRDEQDASSAETLLWSQMEALAALRMEWAELRLGREP